MLKARAGTSSSRCARPAPRVPDRFGQSASLQPHVNRESRSKMKITSVRPWLIQSSASYWGEFLFVEVNTDEGITGWGEITTTTRIANRALTAMLRQIGSMLV